MVVTPVEVAIAILYYRHQFLMQLRDNTPGIVYPGHWGFFGGHLDPGESPETAMWRELQEEIEYVPPHLTQFKSDREDPHVTRHVFFAPLVVPLNQLKLNEGWDMQLLSVEEISQGSHYSAKAGHVCPVVPAVQRILKEFVAQPGMVDLIKSPY
jgi:8-oxo-dGTP pyrophosphatase MutT (NUDIX family)